MPQTNCAGRSKEIIPASCHRLHHQLHSHRQGLRLVYLPKLRSFLRGVSNVTAWQEVRAMDMEVLCTIALNVCAAWLTQTIKIQMEYRTRYAAWMMTRQLNIFSVQVAFTWSLRLACSPVFCVQSCLKWRQLYPHMPDELKTKGEADFSWHDFNASLLISVHSKKCWFF